MLLKTSSSISSTSQRCRAWSGRQPLILYVSTMLLVFSEALVVKKEVTKDGKITKQQLPVYFVLEVLTRSKKYYSEVEKICYALVMSSKKLRHYFRAHTIKVLTNRSLNSIFGNRDSSSRVSKCAMDLSEYVVDFEKRSTIKLKVLADFIAE
jgi:hypothetical protein